MCGIAGYINLTGEPASEQILKQMNDTLIHRGPDGEGYFVRDNVGLAMRRLSIIDLTGSEQPIFNEDKSIAMVFNGEIFNYHHLREQLIAKGHQFRTDGDGETVIHRYEDEADIDDLRGHFAFGLWDSNKQKLILRRDYTGQKPLYYYHDERVFVFASEIKAILKHLAVPRESTLNSPEMLSLYLSYGYIPAPQTAFKNIYMLLPGHELALCSKTLKISPYWQPPALSNDDTQFSEQDIILQLRDCLREATELRMIADVPLGAFLSGGLDSSLIVALMQQANNQTVKTFSMGFEGDDSFDESGYAEQVAQYLQTEHTSFRVKPDAMDLLPKLVWHHDSPFADSSAIPTFLVSELTRKQVTVALTGDGGDELFAGYDRFYAASLLLKMQAIPRPLWKIAAGFLSALPEGTGYYNTIKRAGRFARGASMPVEQAYFSWVSIFSDDIVSELIGQSGNSYEHFQAYFSGDVHPVNDILQVNMRSYLPDDLLIKADRCSMAASLEARAPFLDHKLIEFAATIPLHLKLNGSTTKYVLKETARGLLPDSIIDRKKHGFGVPLGAWLRKDMQPVRDILFSQQARERNLLNMQAVENLITEHSTGKRDHGQRLWTLLTLETWHRQFIDRFEQL